MGLRTMKFAQGVANARQGVQRVANATAAVGMAGGPLPVPSKLGACMSELARP